MKGKTIYIVCILLFLTIVFAAELSVPKSFVWKPTYSRHDGQPFGCKVFDDVVGASLPDGYRVTDETLYRLFRDSVRNTGILIIAEELDLMEADIEAMFSLAGKGCRFVLITSRAGSLLTDTLGFRQMSEHSFFGYFKETLTLYAHSDTVVWYENPLYAERLFATHPYLCKDWFLINDTIHTTLSGRKMEAFDTVENDTLVPNEIQEPVLAFRQAIGRGSVTLASTPLLFTNYGMLDGDNSDYIFRLLNEMKDMPVVRSEAYTIVGREAQTPLRFFLSQPPLRWGIYLSLMVILLFMIFTARRRQRVIPVMGKPVNRSVEFAELIATLYFRKKDYADLVRKKFIYFSETLRRTVQVDVENEDDDRTLAQRIALKTGMDEEKIKKLIEDIHPVLDEEIRITAAQMKDFMDRINEIIKQLKV